MSSEGSSGRSARLRQVVDVEGTLHRLRERLADGDRILGLFEKARVEMTDDERQQFFVGYINSVDNILAETNAVLRQAFVRQLRGRRPRKETRE